ncbi:cell surface protein [Methanosarcina horonobensis HB-1 = JCM 15518]|uniref:Cell surface protein n=2 Tax=Methanosarcina horonobensis TaxID=418008 RepID=A0A0E3SE88_9EURY|nr:cell surface protein [Methanosarcina horonobensis HB-1 = JCM 15518]
MRKKVGKFSKKTRMELLSISCIILLSLFPFTALAENTNISDKTGTGSKISTTLSLKIAETSATEQIPVIILLKKQGIPFNIVKGKSQIENEQKNLTNFLKDAESSKKAQKIKSIKIVNAVAANVTPDVIASLTERPEVSIIELDEAVSIAEGQGFFVKEIETSDVVQNNAWGVDKIGAPAVWQQGITEKRVVVAVVDSGIDVQHPDLDDLDDNPGTNDPKVVDWIDYINGNNSPYDDYGHGTHVAGTISGTGANGLHIGVAPGTNLIAAKVLDESGSGRASNVILAFEWAANNGARVINYSCGGLRHYSPFTVAVDNLVAAGVIPVVAAGNSGMNSYTIECPGDEINSTTVGATDSSDTVADFSSRGPVDLYGQNYIKPDVSAPGVDVESAYPGGSYKVASGTSMATPHVSGTVALMLEKNPALRPSEIKQILESTAVDLGPAGKDNEYGSGRVDAYEAVFFKEEKPILPVANFNSNVTNGYAPLPVQFTDLSQNAVSLSWDFESDGIIDSSLQNPIHLYAAPGTYTVNLIATNENGADSKFATITVLEQGLLPVADFSSNITNGYAPLTVQFTDLSENAIEWSWDFGDKTYSTDANPAHAYKKPGKYTVSLTVKNADGMDVEEKSKYIIVSKRK